MPAQRTPVRDFIKKWGIHLYAVGIVIVAFGSYHFFLTSYGYGGIAEYRGRMPSFNKYFPDGVDYILFNHGTITPISADYYAYIVRMERFGILSYIFVGLPLLLVGFYAYAKKLNVKRSNWRWRLYPAFFIPLGEDPFITKAAKVWWIVLFISGIWFGFGKSLPNTETQFIHWVWLCYAITGAVSSAIAYLLHRVLSE